MQPERPTPSEPTRRAFACERCSRRKQRCDKRLPTCTPCRESGSICSESGREGQAVQLGGGSVARKGCVTVLLERLESLEREATLRGLDADALRDEAATPDSRVSRDSSAAQQAEGRGFLRSRDTPRPFNGHKVDMDTLSLSAMAEPKSRADEFLKQLSMPRIIAGVTQTYGGNPEITSRVDSLWDGISQYIRHPVEQSRRLLVSREEAVKALETYLDVVDFRFPRLPVCKVRSGIEAITAADDAPYRDKLARDPAHIFMAYMVIAIVPLVSDSYPISQGSFVSIHVLAKCLKVLDRVFSQEDGVDIIQCLHLLVVFSIHCSAAGSAWHLIGFAVNKCIALGYHREDARLDPDHHGEEAQQRRWAFWGCYFLDRLICAALARPFSIDNRDVGISLPDEASGAPGSLGPMDSCHVHLFRYAVLLSSLVNEQDADTFHDRLGYLLSWRASAAAHSDAPADKAYLYQTSLFHTLMLRVAIHQILSAYSWGGPLCYISPESGAPTTPAEARRLELGRLRDLSFLDICRAVSRSLNRPGMAGRNFLSLITGYSAFAMSLGVLHHQGTTWAAAVDRGALGTRLPLSMTETRIGARGRSVPGCEEQGQDDWRDLLGIACGSLAITGRQFPRMNEYRNITERILAVLDNSMAHGELRVDGEELKSLEVKVMSIGPNHLRRMARATLFMMTQ